jgi:hypothetical protein
MTRSSVESNRRHYWRAGRFVCALAALIAVMAAVPTVASAQGVIQSVTLQTREGPPGARLIRGINNTGANPLTNSTVMVQRTGTSLHRLDRP